MCDCACISCCQANQAERIRKDIEHFAARVSHSQKDFRSQPFLKYATGFAAAYPALDAAAADLAKLEKQCDHFAELASIFELSGLVPPIAASIKETVDDLTAVKDVWDCAMLCELQFQVRTSQAHILGLAACCRVNCLAHVKQQAETGHCTLPSASFTQSY